MSNKFYKHMSQKEKEQYRAFLLARDGYNCNICKKTVNELLEERAIREKQTGLKYYEPVIIFEHKNNNKSQVNGDDGKYCGNLQLACRSCNNYKSWHEDKSQSIGREPTREKLDALSYEPTYNRNLHIFLIENEHICYSALKIAGKKLSSGGNEVTCLRYFNAQRYTEANKEGHYKVFAYNCGTDICNGTHVCFRGDIPHSLIKQEIEKLRETWSNEYAVNLDEKDRYQWIHKWENINKSSIPPFEEYYQQHSLLLNQFPDIKPEEYLKTI